MNSVSTTNISGTDNDFGRPSGTGVSLYRYPGTSYLATIMLSLRDKIHSSAEALLKLTLMGMRSLSRHTRRRAGAVITAGTCAHFKDHGRSQIPVDYEVPNISLQVPVDRFRQDEAQDCSSMRSDQAYILQLVHQFLRRRKTNFRQDTII